MSASVAPQRTEVVIGCAGSQHVFKIVDGRHVRWQCRRGRCLKKAELIFGRPMKVFHFRDIATGKPSADDEYEDVPTNVE